MGTVMLIPEDKIAAATALTSCGIAYVLKYVQAAMQAGIEMGLPSQRCHADDSTILKRSSRIDSEQRHPPQRRNRQGHHPGGITIKGINELEHNGFTSAIIKAMKASK